jgi:phosphate transport system substrate-binding protein
VVEYVAGDPAAVGYVSLLEVHRDVRVLTLEGVSPDFASVVQGAYPLTRELWLVSHASPSPSVEAFLTFAVSPAGQETIKKWQGQMQ